MNFSRHKLTTKTKGTTMKHTLTLLTALLLAPSFVGSVIAQTPKTKTNGVAPLAEASVGASEIKPATVWATAAAFWSMADVKADRGERALEINGAVTLGVRLSGSERDASLACGGNGTVAAFNGGYLTLDGDRTLNVNPKQWTVAIRMRDPQGAWRYPILGSYDSDQRVSVALRAVDIATKPMLDRSESGGKNGTVEAWLAAVRGPRSVTGTSLIEAVWGAKNPDSTRVDMIKKNQISKLPAEEVWPNPLERDVMNGVMRVNFPVGLIGPTEWHTLGVTMTGPKLQLWIDGVLVDEEFPIGETRLSSLPFLIGAGHENGELKAGFKGLVDHVALWDRALMPAEIAAVTGGQEHVRQCELAILGDESPSMQYFRPRGHNRKAGDCFAYWDERSSTFRLFYMILRRNMHSKWDGGHGGLELWQASTQDLKTWAHHPVTIPISEQWEAWNGTGALAFYNGQYNLFYPSPHYRGTNGGIQRAISTDGVTFTKLAPHPFLPGSDLDIFQDDSGLYNMVKAGPQEAETKRNTMVRLTSLDLKNWTQEPGAFIASEKKLATCPNVFKFGDWHYYTCATGIWKSRSWFGPWEEHTPLRLEKLEVPKTAHFGKDRLISAGFLYDEGWGGNDVLRELVQDADGNLGSRFVKELIPATGEPLKVQETVRVVANEKRGIFVLPKIPRDYRLQLEVVPEAGASTIGIALQADEAEGSGCDLMFRSDKQQVSFSKWGGSSGKPSGCVGPGPSIDAVMGLDEKFMVDIIVRHDILDAEIGGKRTIVTRFWNADGDRIRFFAEGGAVTFRNIRISPLTDTYKPYPAWMRPDSVQMPSK